MLPPGGVCVGGVNAKTAYPARKTPKVRPRIVDFVTLRVISRRETKFNIYFLLTRSA
jgi:hypothetical protein